MNKDLFNIIYNEGKANGLRHFELDLKYQKHNLKIMVEIQLSKLTKDNKRSKVWWSGYEDGMKISKNNILKGNNV